ncbi:MAG: glycosyltransferase [Oscillospiraceae bacterium]
MNIKRLCNAAEFENAGAWLTFRKGINEILHYRMHNMRKSQNASQETLSSNYLPYVSVIICTMNRNEQALECVKSILNQPVNSHNYEVIVVNNTPKNNDLYAGIKKIWKTHENYIGYINEPKKGISNARNAGANHARGEYLLFIDDDAVADFYLLRSIRATFEKYPKIGIVGGQISLYYEGEPPKILNEYTEKLWSAYTAEKRSLYTVRQQYEFPFGACFGVRHTVFDKIGGFNERYGRVGDDYAGGEETLMCLEMLKNGYEVAIEPRAKVVHKVDISRFTEKHVRNTIKAGIFTTYKLSLDGYIPTKWTDNYIKTRIKIVKAEMKRLRLNDSDSVIKLCKESEYDGLLELL